MSSPEETQKSSTASPKCDSCDLEQYPFPERNNDRGCPERGLEGEKEMTVQQDVVSDHHEETCGTNNPSTGPITNGVWTEDNRDPNIVDWDGPDDPENPLNWSPLKKWGNITLLSIITFNIPLASTMLAPGVPQILDEFNTQNESSATFVVSVYVLGLAIGPLILPPLSELYGRVIIYHIGNIIFVVFTAACGLSKNMDMLIGFRFLAGLVGAGAVTIGGGSIGDLTTIRERGKAMSIWSLGPILGPVLGPIAGGFVSENIGWRWIFWILTITSAAIAISSLVFLHETNAGVLLRRKARRLQTETGNWTLRSKLESQVAPKELFLRSILRPSKLLILSPVCFLLSVYNAFIYAMLYFMFSTFTFVFEGQYSFTPATVGLVYIGLGIGMLLALAIQQATGSKFLKMLSARQADGKPKPEHRLPIMMLGGFLIPSGFFIYGWTAQNRVQWAVPLLGTLIIGTGVSLASISINLYLVDAFTIYAASAIGASAVLRSVFGAILPLFALQLFNKIGLGWGNSLLGFIALGMWPVTLVFIKYGEYLRTAPRFNVNL
ncbi:major facilitator superfamily transporter [Colletotrichum navitas]|uniref:Major facilitator superfamily transporter n=1 Tax=Colletotrichum navitas TaxID=681940 RepID=A0AAD8PNX5_9PEZI|nr:major facilitator superfamily transporter [Colletotrichum navitas]KAK1573273.1 major facilitator superfamily transporter [Colletotrichum navitas]